MRRDQLKGALLSQRPVSADLNQNGRINYQYISAIIYRRQGEEIGITLELMDRCKRSVTIARPEKVEYVKDLKRVNFKEEEK